MLFKNIIFAILGLTNATYFSQDTVIEPIKHGKNVLKTHPLSLFNNHLAFAFEHVLKPGAINLEAEAGFGSSHLQANPSIGLKNNFYNSTGDLALKNVAFLKTGIKFLIRKFYFNEPVIQAKNLNSKFIRIDLATSCLNFQDVVRYGSFQNFQSSHYDNYYRRAVSSNINVMAYGAFINYGRQLVFWKSFTAEYFFGLGVTVLCYEYSNPKFLNKKNTFPQSDMVTELTNYFGFIHTSGLSFQSGFRIGYIIPNNNKYKK